MYIGSETEYKCIEKKDGSDRGQAKGLEGPVQLSVILCQCLVLVCVHTSGKYAMLIFHTSVDSFICMMSQYTSHFVSDALKLTVL